MMVKKRVRREFDAAFKREAVRRLHEQVARDGSVAQLARELEVLPDQLRTWAKQAAAREGAPSRAATPSAEEEVRQLRRELETVRMERDFLKKAAAYFATESR